MRAFCGSVHHRGALPVAIERQPRTGPTHQGDNRCVRVFTRNIERLF